MAVLKQLKTKINGKTTDVYPYTSPEAVLNSDGTTLQDTLDNLSNDIIVDLSAKADIESPTLTGIPKAPTATSGTNDTQIATTAFVQDAIDNLINGASEATDTLKELADLIEDNSDLIDTLNGNSHKHNNKTVLDNTTAAFTTELKDKLDGITEGANSYEHPTYTTKSSGLYKITVDNTGHVSGATAVTKSDITALGIPESDTDTTYSAADSNTLGLVKTGSNITNTDGTLSLTKQNVIDALGYTPGSSTDNNTTYTLTKDGNTITLTGSDGKSTSVTDADTDTKYTHPTTSGNKHIPSGGSSGQILRWSSDGTATWGAENNTVTTVTTTGSGNAVTSISASDGKITATKGSTFLTAHPTITKSTDSTSTASPSAGGTFTAIDSITRDENGHVTKVNTKTVTLPSDNTTFSGSYNDLTDKPTIPDAEDFVLSSGDTMTGKLVIKANNRIGLSLNNQNTEYNDTNTINFLQNDVIWGSIGFAGIDTAVVVPLDGIPQAILHTGNSAKCINLDTDPGEGASVSYAENSLLFVCEE